jgi:multiple sugar transport system ATP-binding protein
LVQVGSSREVFERPNSIFVARHLGQPSINEVPCRISSDGGALMLRSLEGNLSFAVNGSQRTMLEKVRSDVLVGIRPQHIHVANGGSAAQIDNALVQAFEPLGATGVLIAETGGVSLTVLTSPEEDFEPGQPVRLGFDVEQFLYFDAVHGRNLQA